MNRIEKGEALAKILGVEVGEEFRIDINSVVKYKICDDGVLCFKRDEDDLFQSASLTVNFLLDVKIIKLPWEPKIGEDYYFPSFLNLNGYDKLQFNNRVVDLRIKNTVGFFRTEKEVITKARELGWLIESEEE
jgi:hypothetical protein